MGITYILMERLERERGVEDIANGGTTERESSLRLKEERKANCNLNVGQDSQGSL